jgi:glutaredoxin
MTAISCPKCSHVRRPGTADDGAPSGHCPACGIVYAKYRPEPLLQPILEPVRASGPRPTSFPFKALLAALLCLATLGFFMRDRLQAKPAPALATHKMSMLMRGDGSEGMPAYSVAREGSTTVARLLPDARKSLSQFTTAKAVIFTTSWCGYCAETRKLFDAVGVPFKEFDVERDIDGMRYHGKVLRAGGVPVIIVGNRVLLGYDEAELRAALAGGG